MGQGRPFRSTRRYSLLTAVVVTSSLLFSCAPQPAPPAAPKTESAPTAAAKAAETRPTAAPAAAPTQPAGAPAASGAVPKAQARGQLIVAHSAELESVSPKDGCANISGLVMDNVYEHLTARDRDGKIVGQLAESFSRPEPNVWRFKLRSGVKYANGEPFNADTVVANVANMVNPQAPGRCLPEFGPLQLARKVDDTTVDIVTTEPDPLMPTRLIKLVMAETAWVKSTPEEQQARTALGSGPYVLTEWAKGSHVLMKVNENYWGSTRPTIAEIKILHRKEAAVRASMVKTGEAHVAHLLPPDLVSDLQTVVEPTTESVGFRINTEHPVLKDLRVRQAIVYSIDTQAMLDTILKGFTVPANGQMVRKSSFGYNSNLKPYPYKLDEAKKLVQEAGAVGAPLEFWNRVGYFPKSEEVAEVIVSSMNQTGLNVSLKNVEIAAGRESLYKVKPGDTRNDFLMTAASNPVFDSSRVMDSYYPCEGRFSMWCDQEFTQKWKSALGLIGEERDKAFQELWSIAYDRVAFAPLFGLDYVHGIDPKLKWTPRDDGFMLFSEMELSS